MIKYSHLLPNRPSWPLLLAALLAYGLIFVSWLEGIGLVYPLSLLFHVVVVASGLLLMGFILAQPSAKLLAPVKIALGVAVFLSVLLYVLALLVGKASPVDADFVAGNRENVSYAAVRRGGMGNTWTDIVERRVYGFILVRDRNVAQYERENVVRIDGGEPGKLKIYLRELGKPDRIDEIPIL